MAKICEIFKNNIIRKDSKRLYLYFEGYKVVETVTYKEFGARVQNFAGYLQSIKSKGACALILLPSSINYITAHVACLFTQTISIPLYEVTEHNQIDDIKKIINNSEAEYIITESRYVDDLKNWLGDMAENLVFCMIDDFTAGSYTEEKIDDDSIAYLQYTSGSTKSAKGVKISYKNIYANCQIMSNHFKFTEDEVFATWLPFHFDLGLLGFAINTIFSGSSGCFTSANSFIKRPDSWLNAISVYRGTIIIAPNFAYEMCSKLPEEILEKTDFSSVKSTVNGSELVRNRTLNSLADKLKKYGLKPETFNPSYGLAENTLVVSSHILETGYQYVTLNDVKLRENVIEYVDEGLVIVSCGVICEGVTARIVGLVNNEVLGEDEIGEIWIAGDSLSQGYWNADEEEGFNSRLEGDNTAYFATGDLGFMHDKHLYIVGRKKDMVIIRGKNFYSQDIEELILNATKNVANTAVAFAINEEEEKLIVMVEVEDRFMEKGEEIKDKIRTMISLNCKIIPSDIVLKQVGALARTDSGKVQRQICKKMYLNDKK
ncbi:AMP-binding protein [Sedimentibacter sp. zth1]|uniref:AMP-binding protein n=1 Tax=Sedimentibacter sp. zth1 TaxID=2816908 RepID=UPI001A92C71B|nr:AMP-binding protein [Sedimentibacter sp. zth1]QSX06258.1 AMP-binding protein [Sedimentibacter sp. zth1]